MLHSVLRLLDGEGGGGDFGKSIEQVIVRVMYLMNEIDWIRSKSTGMLGWQCRVVGETNQLGVSVIGCQVILGKEVGAKYSCLYIGDTEVEFEMLFANNNGTGFCPVAVNISAVGGL